MTDDLNLRELAEKAIAARQESKDPLNKSGIVGQKIFDRVRYVADNEFFKFLDWHGEYGQPVDGPHKILALLDRIEALEKENETLRDGLRKSQALSTKMISAHDRKAADRHCDWVQFTHAFNAMMNDREARAASTLKGNE